MEAYDLIGFGAGLSVIIIVAIYVILPTFNEQLAAYTSYCDSKFGVNNYTMSNGHSCTGKEDLPGMFIGMHDCIKCEAKVD